MPAAKAPLKRSFFFRVRTFFWILLGTFLAAYSVKSILAPHGLIDGGVIGVSMILARLFGAKYLSIAFAILTLPFLLLSLKMIRRNFFILMGLAMLLFAMSTWWIGANLDPFLGTDLEVIVLGGVALGIGAGLVIRNGACIDGTEIVAIIINRKKGFTVGQVILGINVVIFFVYGLLFDWHSAFKSIMIYFVAYKTMDSVIMGFDELKSVMIITSKPKLVSQAVMDKMGLGLTVMYGRGGYSGKDREILYVIVERLDLAELKGVILFEDADAFIAVEDLHEVIYGKAHAASPKKKRVRKKPARTNRKALKSK